MCPKITAVPPHWSPADPPVQGARRPGGDRQCRGDTTDSQGYTWHTECFIRRKLNFISNADAHIATIQWTYIIEQYAVRSLWSTIKGTFTLCPFQYQSPCQSPCPCPMKNQFIRKSEVLFRLHQFPYPYPNQCHPISIRSVSIGPPTVKNWYGRPILSVSGPETCIQGMLHQYLHFKIS